MPALLIPARPRDRLRLARRAQGLTAVRLASMTKCNPRTIYNIEYGKKRIRPSLAREIEGALGLGFGYLGGD